MSIRIAVEDWVGESRAAIVEHGKIVELHFDRWSEQGKRAFMGEVYRGRIRKIDGSLNAAFIDLGRGPDGFLPFGKKGRPAGLHEGAAIGVRVTREAQAEKGPNLTFCEVEDGKEAPLLLDSDSNLTERLLRRYPDAEPVWADEADIDLQAAIDAACSPRIGLVGGGAIEIEPTKALTAIDIDSAGKTVNAGRRLALDTNLIAMPEIARQIRLRGLGGNIVIDCLQMRAQPDRKAVEAALRKALKPDPAKVELLPVSRFGLIEMTRQRAGRSVMDWLDDDPVETIALAALRQLEQAATAQRGAQLLANVSRSVMDWLHAAPFDWQAALTDRLGPRTRIEARADIAVDYIDIRRI